MTTVFLNSVKTLSLAFIMLLSLNAIAQDIILKQDGSEIKAKVLEITDQQIKYKDFDFQSGPTRNINIPDVFMITYENGQKEVFNKKTSTSITPPKEVFSEQTPTPTVPEKTHNASSSDLKREFDRIGTNDIAMLNFFMQNNFFEYYDRFGSACHQRAAGRVLLSSGIACMASGAVWMILAQTLYGNPGPFDYDAGDRYRSYMITGGIFMSAGEILTIVSIPVSASAGAKKKAIKNDFAREYFGVEGYTYQPKLNFGATSNGIGLTLNF